MENKVLKASFWYTISRFFLKGLTFFTTPIFARILTKSEYGAFSNFNTWYSMIAIIATLSLTASLIRGRFEHQNDLDSFISSNLVLGSLSTILFASIILRNSSYFIKLFNVEKKYLCIMFLIMLVSPAYDMFIDFQRYKYKYRVVIVTTILYSLTSIGLSLLLVMTMEDKLLGRVLGNYIPYIVISLVIYIYFLIKSSRIKIDYWKYSIVICIPYVFHLLSGTVLNSSDRAMITSICGTEDTALYSMAYNIALIVNILWGSMNSAFGPWLGEKLHENNYCAIKKYTYYYLGIFTIIILGLILIAPEAMMFLGGKKYINAKYVIPPVMVGYYFIFVYSLYVNVEQFEKKTKAMAIATFAAAIVNLVTNAIFLPSYGYLAASYTTLFCDMLLAVFHFILVKQMKLDIIYDTRYIVLVSLFVCAFSGISLLLYIFNVLRYIIVVFYIFGIVLLIIKHKKIILSFIHR